MSLRYAVTLSLVLMVAAACSTTGGGSPALSARASGSGGLPTSPSSLSATRIAVTLSDALRIEPPAITVKAGVPMTFIVTNAGSTDHEFYLGDEAAQGKHQQEMDAMGGMAHDEAGGVGVKPGQTKELTYTFTGPGQTLAGCHVDGHYGLGMKATITVSG